jgi:excisionase family DNA binding protein
MARIADRESFIAGFPAEHRGEGMQEWDDASDRIRAEDKAMENRKRIGGDVVPGAAAQRQFMTVREVSRRWAMHERSVWRMISDGRLNAYKISNSRRLLVTDVEKCERNDGQNAA